MAAALSITRSFSLQSDVTKISTISSAGFQNLKSSSSLSHKHYIYSSETLYLQKYIAGAARARTIMASTSTKTGSLLVHAQLTESKQALVSLSDKRDLELLGRGLQNLGYAIVSTGGTASALEQAGIPVTKVEQVTNFPEMLDGRVKTLHPAVHGGILARRDQQRHMDDLKNHGIGAFDLVVVNLYPFYEKVSSSNGISFEDGVENIDIGGPAMIRAAAKNHKHVLVVVDPADYPSLLGYLQGEGNDGEDLRRKFAWKAFQHVASYDSAVAEWFWKQLGRDEFPPRLTVPLSIKSPLRYGENPHQKAAFYADESLCEVDAGGIATAVQHHGKVPPTLRMVRSKGSEFEHKLKLDNTKFEHKLKLDNLPKECKVIELDVGGSNVES